MAHSVFYQPTMSSSPLAHVLPVPDLMALGRTRTSLATMIAGARQPGQRARAGSGPVRFLERVPETYLSLTREPAAAGQVRQHEEAAG